MDDDTPTDPRPPPAKMSMTPSWVMLGFVLGAFFVWALPEPKKELPSSPVPVERTPETTTRPPRLPHLTDVEAVFAQWDRYAIWENDVTEIAYWNEETRSFSNFFEVLRSGDRLFFRSIPKLTRPLIR
ncbi:MAG TPA: hypothetical protein VMC06_11605, partial [Opitutaceae bacterium]|nr:hypothetical protein [Opitutaceae bacterium]